MFRRNETNELPSNMNMINEYVYRFNGNPNYEAIFSIGGSAFRVNVLTNESQEHGVATIEVWNKSMGWNHVHTIPGSLMLSRTTGLTDVDLIPSVFREDLTELVTVANLVYFGLYHNI